MVASMLQFLFRLAKALSAQFGPSCEVVVHDLSAEDPAHSIVHIENGHVTGRKVGDGPSNVVLEQIMSHNEDPQDCLGYLCRTDGGKVLKSSTVYIRDRKGKVSAILAINYDISRLILMEEALRDLVSTGEEDVKVPLADITYIEAENVYVVIHTVRGDYRTRISLAKFTEQLDDTFLKVHRSYVVALKYIRKITRKEITMQGGGEIPIRRGMYDDVHDALVKYL